MTTPDIMLDRRALLALGAAAAAVPFVARAEENTVSTSDQFWPNNARLAVSFSLMFEAGGQPISGARAPSDPWKRVRRIWQPMACFNTASTRAFPGFWT